MTPSFLRMAHWAGDWRLDAEVLNGHQSGLEDTGECPAWDSRMGAVAWLKACLLLAGGRLQ
jgi:hypothetical protein